MIRRPSATLQIILAQRLWQALSGLVTIMLITSLLTPEQQGWYYSLLGIAALYTLFDLGLSHVLLQAAAHAAVDLQLTPSGRPQGRGAGELEALLAWAIRHYAWLTLAFALVILPAGFVFFGSMPASTVSWQWQWVVLVLGSAAALLLLPFLVVAEGAGDIREVYAVRLAQGVTAAITGWVALSSGAGLWAVIAAPLGAIVVQCLWLAWRKPGLLLAARCGIPSAIRWRSEIWPHQWQIGVGWLCGYLLTQAYPPLLFKTQDAVIAGQMGLTLTASNMIGILAQSWITRHVPAMSGAVAQRRWDDFERIFRHDFILSCMAFCGGALALCVIYRLLNQHYAERLLPFWPFAGVLATGFLLHVQNSLAAQLRSFRREPLLWVSVAGAALTISFALWGALHYSAAGVVTAMLAIQLVVALPSSVIIWRRNRQTWRNDVAVR